MTSSIASIEAFVDPLRVDLDTIESLSHAFLETFEDLALNSQNQFLPTPILETILRPDTGRGTNLRVGFVEVRAKGDITDPINQPALNAHSESSSRIRRLLEKSWPIADHLKDENPDSLFLWIGSCIAEVIHDGFQPLGLSSDQEIPLGVTFSFPMVQHSLSEATLMPMGKGFAISSNLNLGARLLDGYNRAKVPDLPSIRVEAIANDSVSTLISFISSYGESATRRASMGLILGTGCNATIPLKLRQLHPSKHPQEVPVRPGQRVEDVKVAVNTEWSINGTAPPLRQLGLLSRWDEMLDSQNEIPGFQPLEYMTAGRYLGELGRIILVDYMTNRLGIAAVTLPAKLLQRHGLTTAFLSHFRPVQSAHLLPLLRDEFPETSGSGPFTWTQDLVVALYHIAKAIEVRAAGIVAAATMALLTLAGDVPRDMSTVVDGPSCQLGVGYTGGCIVHFQDYLVDCQKFLDQLLDRRFKKGGPLRVVLSPCHDGGITGAGVLVAAAISCFISLSPSQLSLSLRQTMSIPSKTGTPAASTGSSHSEPNGTSDPLPVPVPAGPGAQRRSIPNDGDNGQSGVGDETTIDAAVYEVLSRSLTTAGQFLEPEPIENAMLRLPDPASKSNPNPRSDEEAIIDYDNDDEFCDDSSTLDEYENSKPTERSPLLRPRALSKARSEASATTVAVTLSTSSTPFLNDVSPTRFWFIFSQVLLGYFIACFDGTIMASSHPVITSYFHASNSASWLSTAFLLTSSAFQPLMGRLSDSLGRKPLWVGCLFIFTVATLGCAVATSIETFILARALCGIGAGGISALGSIIVSDLVPIENRGTYQSYLNANYGVGAALGAASGGAMADYFGWRWEFGIQVPPLLLAMIISSVAIPDDLGIQGDRKTMWQALKEFDSMGSLLLTTAVTTLILGLNFGGNILPWSHPFVIASLTTFAVVFPLFIWVESWVYKPIMPLSLLRQSPRANLIFSNCIASFLANSIIFNIPLFFQAVLLNSATSSGLRLVIPTIASSTTGTMVGFAVQWTRRLKWPVQAGTICSFIGIVGLSGLTSGLPDMFYLFILLPSSIGQGFQFPGTFMAILAASTQAEQAVVTSTLVLWRSLGQVLGVASSSLVLQNALSFYLDEYVQGDQSADVIRRVRRSVEEVYKLEPPYQDQVRQSYEAALHLTFMTCAFFALASVLMVLPIKLPRLGPKKR
ncbi:hypothetical protein BGZ63DRAFT_352577 [Mariannaea sp. PMI_226]|nr:hypothetical protein BGZ63DRAFT_352577 [Mariannaea sp. PMI_226]